ncbi:MAG TPA: TA system VapC family ribonuclease toxin [Bryobacteraceae bacterium]|nr:TA system VapC family ribonuclease toxin [Bryobacteraceae bacterium]
MTFLADVNFWLALEIDDHVHHATAMSWTEEAPEDDLALCRVTQKGFLRLLTNPHVMKGEPFTAPEAWRSYDTLRSNRRVRFAEEPLGLEPSWRNLTRHPGTGPNFWTDAYLTAFAEAAGFLVLTFDRNLAKRAGEHARLLAAI